MEIMKENKKREKKRKPKLEEPSAWVQKVMKGRENPLFKTPEEALVAFTKKFEALAKKMGFPSTAALWQEAEHATEIKEGYLEALNLARNIQFLKYQIKK